MNKNSQICCFIKEHDNWKEIFENEYGITVKEEYPYAIFKYGIESNFSNPVVQEARGIILDVEKLDVVCWPFRKFGNYNESYSDKIDWSTARVQAKIDGSIMKMWYSDLLGKWCISSNSMIHADSAIVNQMTGETLEDIFLKADNYSNIHPETWNKNYTYIFELVSPETQVVIKYENAHIYHIGTRNNVTGEELNEDIGIEKPKEYPLKSLDDCINAANILNQSEDGEVHDVKKEGYVVVDKMWNRIKVKSPDYLMLHHMSSNTNFSKERIVGLIREKTICVSDICKEFPSLAHYFKYYDFKVAELEYQAKVFCDLTKRLYEEYSHDRKAVAMIIKSHRLASLGFMCLDTEKDGNEILSNMTIGRYCKYIPDYNAEKLSKLFYKSKTNISD